ncbi:glycosyltransferase family 4 protein [Chitinilyticum litopenaei]|uniref:glycosyltransferase family 4 protein n=1 Tax=Chitinilyticum litopenaei TaxID=1121276 RepID=UPI000406AA22|nr:glycosyltransferase family 4 protein [Chitinilyticum litopenaei]
MRLAYIDPQGVPGHTVESLQILQNVDAFAEAGLDVELVTPRAMLDPAAILARPLHPRVTRHGLRDHRRQWYFPINSQKLFFWQVWRWLAKHPVDGIYVRNLKLADWLLSRGIKTPLFFETHEVFAQTYLEEHPVMGLLKRYKYRKLRQREQRVYRQARAVFGLTSMLCDDIAATYGPIRACHVLPDGVDLTAANTCWRDEAWQPHSPLQLLYLGSLHPWKGISTLLAAMSQVEGAMLNIAGGNEPRIAELRQECNALGCQDRVHFLGPIPPAERFALIAKHDVCILPLSKTSIGSRYTSPLKLFEYMAMGKPVIAADLPSIREVLQHKLSGYLFEAENPGALATAIRQLQTNSSLASVLAEQARALVLDYTWLARARKLSNHLAAMTEKG